MPTGTMQALRKVRPERGAAVENIPIPEIGPTDVLVRVSAASICGTDLHIYGWDRWSASRIHPPMTFGHEFCGVVERVGEEVSDIKPGEFVSAEMHVVCGNCRQCRMGQPHVCQNLEIIGIDRDGCFADFVKIPASNIWKIDPAIPEHYGAILDPLGKRRAYGALRRNRGTNRGRDGLRPDWIDGDRGGEGLRRGHSFRDGSECAPALDGAEDGRG